MYKSFTPARLLAKSVCLSARPTVPPSMLSLAISWGLSTSSYFWRGEFQHGHSECHSRFDQHGSSPVEPWSMYHPPPPHHHQYPTLSRHLEKVILTLPRDWIPSLWRNGSFPFRITSRSTNAGSPRGKRWQSCSSTNTCHKRPTHCYLEQLPSNTLSKK